MIQARGTFEGRVTRAGGRQEAPMRWSNFITDEGLGTLARLLSGEARGGGWEIGLKGVGEPFLDDTLQTRGWPEAQGLAARVPWRPQVMGAALSNRHAPALLEFTQECVIEGVFVTRADGVLLSVGDRGFAEPFGPGDTFELTYTIEFGLAGGA